MIKARAVILYRPRKIKYDMLYNIHAIEVVRLWLFYRSTMCDYLFYEAIVIAPH